MDSTNEELQLTALEKICSIGMILCLLFATWELNHLMADRWFANWVDQDRFVNRRIILYGVAGVISLLSIFLSLKYSFTKRRFVQTVNLAFLWYGTMLLISTIAFFVFDCLPEVCAGVIGAVAFIAGIFIIQRKFYTRERVRKNRIAKGQCYVCGEQLRVNAMYCGHCGAQAGKKCAQCNSHNGIDDTFCVECKQAFMK